MNLKGPFSQLLLECGSTDGTMQKGVEVAPEPASNEQETTTVSRLSRKHVGRAAGTGKLEVSGNFL